jgi:hypothetical protein
MSDRTMGKKMSELNSGAGKGAILLKGIIFVPSDFPTLLEVKTGWMYLIGANVTDNDISKTNTGQSFLLGDEIVWNGTNWSVMGEDKLWTDSGTDLSPLAAGRSINVGTGLLKDSILTSGVSVNNLYQWDRALLAGSTYYVTPRHAGDVLKLKSNLYVGSVDPFGRTQLWNYEASSVIRLGALVQDGDPVNSSSEGCVFYGKNAQADAMDDTHWGYFRAKPYRIGIYNSAPSYVGYLFRLDTQTNECYLCDNDGNKTFDFNRLTSELTILNSDGRGFGWDGDRVLELRDSVTQTNLLWRTDGTWENNYVGYVGVASTNDYSAQITKMANNALMTGTENGIMFSQTYYDATTPLAVNEGYFGFTTLGNWTSDPTTQDSGFVLRCAIDGVLSDALYIDNTKFFIKNATGGNALALYMPMGAFRIVGSAPLIAVYDASNNGIELNANGAINNYFSSNSIKSTLYLVNAFSDTSMTNVGSAIDFANVRYGSASYIHSGKLLIATENNWTTDTSTQNSYAKLQVCKAGILTDALFVHSNLTATVYDIWSYNSSPTFSSGNQIINKTYADSCKLPPYRTLTAMSDGQTSFALSLYIPDTTKASFIVINGVTYHWFIDFTISGTTLIWTNATYTIQAGDILYFYYYSL